MSDDKPSDYLVNQGKDVSNRRTFIKKLGGAGIAIAGASTMLSSFEPPALAQNTIVQGAVTTLTETAVYVSAHPDDWQLFMNLNVYSDMIGGTAKVIIIHTTSGDAGMGKTFWSAREEGVKSSVRMCLNSQGPITESSGKRMIGLHSINYWTANNVTSYFMRLPDGGDGTGWPADNNQSLTKLRAKKITKITAVDSSETYVGWQDFTSTIFAIITKESVGAQTVIVNSQNPDTTVNIDDHADHIATGQAVQDINLPPTIEQLLYIDYELFNFPVDTTSEEACVKGCMFSAYDSKVYDLSGHRTIGEARDAYIGWCLRNSQYIVINAPAGKLALAQAKPNLNTSASQQRRLTKQELKELLLH